MAEEAPAPDPATIDIGIFAHNEAGGIAAMLGELARQDLFCAPGRSVRVHLLANGCSDDTVAVARAAVASGWPGAPLVIHDLAEGGKSRTWNRFVHDLSRPEAGMLMFCDADIRLPAADSLSRLVAHLEARPGLQAVSSRPVKDMSHDNPPRGPVERLIALAGGTLGDWKTSICGQLYVMPAAMARRFHLPVGLPVEDGFVRTMVASDVMRQPGDLSRLDGAEGVFHVYESERRLGPLVRHQVRIIIGSAINAQLFAELAETPDVPATLERAAADPDWLGGGLSRRLPRWYGWGGTHFVTRRFHNWRRSPSLKRTAALIPGLAFDAVVYVIAQARMARGTGAGFW